MRADLPADQDTEAYVRARVAHLLASPGLPALLDGLTEAPVPDPTALGAVTCDVLVLAQEGDPVHPASVARRLAAALPRARLHVFDRPGVLWHDRARFRELVLRHLGDA